MYVVTCFLRLNLKKTFLIYRKCRCSLLSKRIRPSKVQQEKKRILLDSILNKWVCFKQSTNNDEKYVFMKHTLRDRRAYSKVEQRVLSNNPVEAGVYSITDYEMERVLDITKNTAIIDVTPVRDGGETAIMASKN